MQKVTIYTDGSCMTNPGKGGYGALLMTDKFAVEITGGFQYTTNNRMELLSVIDSLRALQSPSDVTIYSDSQYVVNSINNGWIYNWERNSWIRERTGPVPNADLWKETIRLLTVHKVTFIWIRGHNKNPYNERCDCLAKQASNGANLAIDFGYLQKG